MAIDFSEERRFIENILNQRFNFFITIYSGLIVAVFTQWKDYFVVLALCVIGFIILAPLTLTLWRANYRLNTILYLIDNDQNSPTVRTNMTIENKEYLEKKAVGFEKYFSGTLKQSRRNLIGYWIPLSLICIVTAIIVIRVVQFSFYI